MVTLSRDVPLTYSPFYSPSANILFPKKRNRILPTLFPYNPTLKNMVWAFPFSLAATWGIKLFFFSSAYWDVSLQRVRHPTYIGLIWVYHIAFTHSEISGSKVAKHLTEAYRSHATSFIALISLGIHHLLLIMLANN